MSSKNENKQIVLSEEVSRDLGMKTEKVAIRPLTSLLHATGQIHPEVGKELSISVRISGRVVEVLVQPGQKVKKGDVLAVIDSHDLCEIQAELIEARAAYELARAHEQREKQILDEEFRRPKALIEAKTQLEEDKAQMDLAEREFKRQEELLKERISAAKDYYVAKTNYISAQASYKQSLSTFEREENLFESKAVLKRDYLLAQAETKKQLKHVNTLKQRLIFLGMPQKKLQEMLDIENISGTLLLLAPADGTVTFRGVDVGEILREDKQAFTITDLRTVSIVADIPEIEVRRLKVGTRVIVKASGFPGETFEGKISYIGTHINPELRTVPVRAQLPNEQLKLKANMFAELDLLEESQNVLCCPKSAIQERDGHKFVFVYDGQGYKAQRINTGISSEEFCEVLSVIKEGDQVVTAGSLLLKTESGQVH